MAARTFLALDLDEKIRDGIVEARERIGDRGAKIKWVERENLHVTLKFLGDVEDTTIADVCRIAAEAAAKIEPFDFTVRGIITVPPGGRLRMFWVGVEDSTSRVAELYKELDAELRDLPIHQENRPFKPHITLARIRSANNPAALRDAAAQFAQTDFGVQHAEQVTIYSSQLTPKGPIYTPIAHPKLGG